MLIAATATACYFILWIDNEEGYTTGLQYKLLNFIYAITAFAHIMLSKGGILGGWKAFFAGLFVSSVCYSIVIEFACVRYAISKSKIILKTQTEKPPIEGVEPQITHPEN
jgi:hypothetical protein